MSSQQAAFLAAESLKDSVLKQWSWWCAATSPACAFDKAVEYAPKITSSLSEDIASFHETLDCGQTLWFFY